MSRQLDVHSFGARPARGQATHGQATAGQATVGQVSAAPTHLVVVLQHDSVPGRLIVVAPLVLKGSRPVLTRYAPLVSFDASDYLIATNELAAVDKADLGPALGNLAHHRDAIVRALDLLFTGF